MPELCLIPVCLYPAVRRGRLAQHASERALPAAGAKVDTLQRWKLTRRRYLSEHPLCERCGEITTDVHHRVDIADGGDPMGAGEPRGALPPSAETIRSVRQRKRGGSCCASAGLLCGPWIQTGVLACVVELGVPDNAP